MFNIGEFVVCPGHGVGKVQQIDGKCLGGETLQFYTIKLISSGLKMMVPVNCKNSNSIRALLSQTDIDNLINHLKDHNFEPDLSTWNRRQRDYLNKIKTGSLFEVADVVRSLYIISVKKGLSFGEKKMLSHCKELLVEEISCIQNRPRIDIHKDIDDCFNGQNIAL